MNHVSEQPLTLRARVRVGREEDLTHAVAALLERLEAQAAGLRLEEAVRQLHLNARAVTREWISPRRRPVPQPMQHLEPLLHDGARLRPTNVRHEANAARGLLRARLVQRASPAA